MMIHQNGYVARTEKLSTYPSYMHSANHFLIYDSYGKIKFRNLFPRSAALRIIETILKEK